MDDSTQKHRLILVAGIGFLIAASGWLTHSNSVLAASVPRDENEQEETPDPFARWEAAIAKMEAADQAESKPRGGVLFVGSSSIRLWDLEQSFPGLPAINHGFGGSEIADSVHFADRIVVPFAPKVIVLYAGDNDIAKGKTAAVVVRDYKLFSDLVSDALPETHIVFVAIKPSLSRWALSDEMKTANDAIADLCEVDEQRSYLDIWNPMLGDDGKPRPEMFVKDGLHMNDVGYSLWNDILSTRLQELDVLPIREE